MGRVWGPPSRCAACGRFGGLEQIEGPTACACGATLPPRPFLDTVDLPFPQAGGPPDLVPTPGMLARPVICGTALLTISRIGQLRAIGEQARIGARVADGDDDELEVSFALDVGAVPTTEAALPGTTPLALPAELGVVVVPAGAAFAAGTDALVELAPGKVATCRAPARGARPGSSVTVTLRFADALYHRVVVVEPTAPR